MCSKSNCLGTKLVIRTLRALSRIRLTTFLSGNENSVARMGLLGLKRSLINKLPTVCFAEHNPNFRRLLEEISEHKVRKLFFVRPVKMKHCSSVKRSNLLEAADQSHLTLIEVVDKRY